MCNDANIIVDYMFRSQTSPLYTNHMTSTEAGFRKPGELNGGARGAGQRQRGRRKKKPGSERSQDETTILTGHGVHGIARCGALASSGDGRCHGSLHVNTGLARTKTLSAPDRSSDPLILRSWPPLSSLSLHIPPLSHHFSHPRAKYHKTPTPSSSIPTDTCQINRNPQLLQQGAPFHPVTHDEPDV